MKHGPISGTLAPLHSNQNLEQPTPEALRTLFDKSSVGLAMLDAHRRFLHANAAMAELLGVPVEALSGRELSHFCASEISSVHSHAMAGSLGDDARVATELRIERPDGRSVWAALSLSATTATDGVAFVIALHDITERKEAEERLVHQAYHDPLTSLANRELFRERVEHALARCARDAERIAVILLDLDNFKTVNDTQGHEAGDRLLKVVARRLQSATRGCDTVARLGGDEFGILLEDVDVRAGAQTVAERVLSALRKPIALNGGRTVTTGGSIGIAVYDGSEGTEELLRNADVAMYEAKGKMPGRWVLFDPSMHRALIDRVTLEADLHNAVERELLQQRPRLANTSVFPAFESRTSSKELSLAYQPIVDLTSGVICGFEALARWTHPTHGVVSPELFIPLAEKSELICKLGRWVLREACKQGAKWNASRRNDPLTITVNLSARQLELDSLAGEVAEVMHETGLDPRHLILEITESVIMQNAESMLARLRELKQLGVGLAIDDFGTGYSSLAYLQRFPVNVLKIDRIFTEQIRENGEGTAFVRTILALAELLSLKTIAEGVESPMQREVLTELGCDRAQGFLFGRPLLASEITLSSDSRCVPV